MKHKEDSESCETRMSEASRIREKYPGRIPVIVEKDRQSDVPDIDKKKYLVPEDLTVGQFVYVVRERIKLGAEKAIFFFVKNTFPPTAALMSAIYEEHKDQDGFLYLNYSGEDIIAELLVTTRIVLDIMDSITTEVKGTKCLEVAPRTWSFYLSRVETLLAVSQSHEFVMEQTRQILKPRLNAFSSLVTMFAKRDDQKWVFTVRDCINSQVRNHFAKKMFLHEEEAELDIFLPRSDLLNESFQHVIDATPFQLHGEISIYFEDEEAVGEGAFREWLLLVCQELFKPERNLFVQSADDGRRFRPKSGSAADSNLRYFQFAGRLIALAIKHNVQVGVLLDNVFYLQLANKPVLLEDVKLTDSTEYNSCVKVLQMTLEEFEKADLGLSFAIEIQEDSNRILEVPLRPNGQDISVTFDNKDTYIHLRTEMMYVKLVKEPVLHFAQGFADLIDVSYAEFFNTLDLSDLDGLLRGVNQDAISIEAWKLHTDYENFEETDDVIRWFWEIINDMDQNRRQNILFFWTAVRYLPMGGFADLSRMTIARICLDKIDQDMLPESSTCFFELRIPKYDTFEKTEKHLMLISESEVSIGFGNT